MQDSQSITLSYQATLEDIAEPTLRSYFRSQTSATQRRWSAVSGATLLGLAIMYVFRNSEPAFRLASAIIATGIGAALNFFSYRYLAAKRIKKHMQQEHGNRLPYPTEYLVDATELKCFSLGATVTFPLSALDFVKEDEKYLELNFGKIGLCTIPLRAFSSPSEKENFLRAVQRQ